MEKMDIKEYKRNWAKENKEHLRKYRQNWDRKLKIECINYYSKGNMDCNCCGEKEVRFLCLDHIDQNGAEHRRQDKSARHLTKWLKRNNFPKGFQVLCYNCNFATSHFGGICPHKN